MNAKCCGYKSTSKLRNQTKICGKKQTSFAIYYSFAVHRWFFPLQNTGKPDLSHWIPWHTRLTRILVFSALQVGSLLTIQSLFLKEGFCILHFRCYVPLNDRATQAFLTRTWIFARDGILNLMARKRVFSLSRYYQALIYSPADGVHEGIWTNLVNLGKSLTALLILANIVVYLEVNQ